MPTNDDLPPTRLRFEDPETFLAFYDKQLERSVVGVRHPRPLPAGTALRVIISPPGAGDRLQLAGRVERARPRADGSARLKVRVETDAADRAWLEAYVSGLRAGVGAALRDPTSSLDMLDGATYYALLGLEPDAEHAQIRIRFAESLRRANATGAPDRLRRRLTEAYGVLRDPRLRAVYDAGLRGPLARRQVRLEPISATAASPASPNRLGDQYWRLARRTLEQARTQSGDRRAAAQEALRLLRVATVFDPQGEHIRHAMQHVQTLVAQQR